MDTAFEKAESLESVFSGIEIDERLPKTAQAYEIMRAAIISMRLVPGSAISEKDICQLLGFSRTPLREAILQLASERLVVIKPGGGTFVTKILLSEVLQGQLVRDTMEMRLLKLAAKKYTSKFDAEFDLALYRQKSAAKRKDADEFFALDNEYHQLICKVAGFPDAWRIIHDATGQLDRVRRLAFPVENNFGEVLAEHTEMYKYLKANDPERAAAAFQIQLDSTFPTIDIIHRIHPEVLDGTASIEDIR